MLKYLKCFKHFSLIMKNITYKYLIVNKITFCVLVHIVYIVCLYIYFILMYIDFYIVGMVWMAVPI